MRLGDDSYFSWELGNGVAMMRIDFRGPLISKDTDQAVDAAIRGVALAYCLRRRVAAEVSSGELEIVLEEWTSTGQPFTMYYPSRRQTQPGLRELIRQIRQSNDLTSLVGRD
jgi:DNA-binding transcriptional LysR family regulator